MKQSSVSDIQHQGLLITLEGGEGAGKTTQIIRLKKHLIDAGHQVVTVREPGGTVISEQIRTVLLSKENSAMADTTEVLLFQAARAQIYAEVVLPALQAGKMVVMDRSRDSSVVYQGIVRNMGVELINQLNAISTQATLPDVTLLLDVSPQVGLQRVVNEGNDNRIEMEGVKFHEAVNAAYHQLAQQDQTGRWRIIDANQSLDAVDQSIWKTVQQFITERQ